MNHWWVNQNQTYDHEVQGGYLWSPKTSSNGRRNRFYDAMTETIPGDIVFSFCDTDIKAIGVVPGPCQSAPRPTKFGSAGQYWNHEGWFVTVSFPELARPIRPKDHSAVMSDYTFCKKVPSRCTPADTHLWTRRADLLPYGPFANQHINTNQEKVSQNGRMNLIWPSDTPCQEAKSDMNCR